MMCVVELLEETAKRTTTILFFPNDINNNHACAHAMIATSTIWVEAVFGEGSNTASTVYAS